MLRRQFAAAENQEGETMKAKDSVKKALLVISMPIVLYLVFFILRPASFGNGATLYNVFQQSIISCIIAWGMSFTMMMNQFDLAVGSEIVLVAIFGAMLSPHLGIPGIIIGCVAGGLVTGILKAMAFKLFKIPTMILTIALTYLFAAFGGILTNAASLVIPTDQSILAQAPWNIIIFLAAGVIIYILHRFSPYGARARAVSGNENLARINGINVDRIKITALLISSLFAGIAAVLKLCHGSSVAPTTGLASIATILEPIMSVFVGIVLSKFVNIVLGIFIGAFLMSIISNGLIAVSMPPSYNNVVVGGVLIALMVFINLKSLMDEKKINNSAAKIRKDLDKADA